MGSEAGVGLITEQSLILSILVVTLALFVWGRWRHDMVAIAALLACVATGLVDTQAAFYGFGHPAVVTVACVLILSRGLLDSGAVDTLVRVALPRNAGATLTLAALAALAAALSSVINNVGALALLMPAALQLAKRHSLPPGRMLMPLAFASILGGMTTLVGTPPNLIVSGFRAHGLGEGYAMFDFTPVGLSVAVLGVAFVALVGWRLVPQRARAGTEEFETGAYITEARVLEESKAVGMRMDEVETSLAEADAQVLAVVRNEARMTAPLASLKIRSGDILLIHADAKMLSQALAPLGLELEASQRPQSEPAAAPGSQPTPESGNAQANTGATDAEQDAPPADAPREDSDAATTQADEFALMECAIMPHSTLVGRSAIDLMLRTTRGINLLGISRQGRRSTGRLRAMPMMASDVLLLQGRPDALTAFASSSGCLPLAARELRVPDRRRATLAALIMVGTLASAALGLLPVAASFAAGVLASMALRTVSLRGVYGSVDWPVIVLLAALIPIADALVSTGAAALVASALVGGLARGEAIIALVAILVVTMTLSDLMNNAATAAMMCPIAIGTAGQLGANSDAFLMAVAVGASCAFLTPIGHQNNTLILGPGGFRFGDYWRLGLPLELLVVAVAVPMLLWVWPI